MAQIEVSERIEEASPGLQTVKRVLTSAELLALHTAATAVELVPGRPGQIIIPEAVYYKANNGTAYSGSRNLLIRHDTATSVVYITTGTNTFLTVTSLQHRFQPALHTVLVPPWRAGY